ncbi:MAG: M61 family metallopeptidase [Bryobacterales bacterium]|nr:M61 family metallopeptidase [Bryobacterales bacterium]
MHKTISLLFLVSAGISAQTMVNLAVDASEAPRRLFHARMTMDVKPGPMRLVYPKWIPGEHSPTGPVTDLAALRITANGTALRWRRDDVDMYAIGFEVPAGASKIEVSFDFLSPPDSEGFSSGASATSEMAVVSWNQLLLYPEGDTARGVQFTASLKVPKGWKYGTALPIAHESGDMVEFQPAPLETLVDSPVMAGRYFRTIELTPGEHPAHYIHLAADSAEALEVKPEVIGHYRNLVAETGALYGARHYRSYHFLVSLSDHVAHFGLEHHESSDNRMAEDALTEDGERRISAGLLPHEMTHSWNGKYRRPAGLATKDYQQPMKGDLLWIYEGLTTYLGSILTPRSGLQTPEDYRAELALDAAALVDEPGRDWRPLEDTAVAAQLLYAARRDYQNRRRSVDYYPEGELIWLEADVTIRKLSGGKRSLNDFCRRFLGGESGKPEVKPYTLADVIDVLQAVQPYDWKGFFTARVDRIDKKPPLGGIAGAGWRLTWREDVPEFQKVREGVRKQVDVRYSLGLVLREDGTILDVIEGSPADRAGMAPAGTLLAVNGRQFTGKSLRGAIRMGKESSARMKLIVKDGEIYKTFRVECHSGERYPVLEREQGVPDLLSEIIRPLEKQR